MNVSSPTTADAETVAVRRVRAGDIADVIALDERVTGLAKPDYWHDVFARYGERRPNERFFLVAERGNAKSRPSILGFIVGEVRAWEFGSTPCRRASTRCGPWLRGTTGYISCSSAVKA